MNQEAISQFIKEIRLKNNLSQEKFGEKYGVTYQAVSKWETGKSIPDIAILQAICQDNNKDINELLNPTSYKKNKKQKYVIIAVISVIILLVSGLVLFKYFANDDSFHFKTIGTSCDNFELYGSMAYDSNKTSIYISNITYCGAENTTRYQDIDCTLYEVDGNSKTKIESVSLTDQNITLEEFLKNVNFNVDHYSNNCKMYRDNGMIVEIKATDKNNETTFYSIPLVLKDNC